MSIIDELSPDEYERRMAAADRTGRDRVVKRANSFMQALNMASKADLESAERHFLDVSRNPAMRGDRRKMAWLAVATIKNALREFE